MLNEYEDVGLSGGFFSRTRARSSSRRARRRAKARRIGRLIAGYFTGGPVGLAIAAAVNKRKRNRRRAANRASQSAGRAARRASQFAGRATTAERREYPQARWEYPQARREYPQARWEEPAAQELSGLGAAAHTRSLSVYMPKGTSPAGRQAIVKAVQLLVQLDRNFKLGKDLTMTKKMLAAIARKPELPQYHRELIARALGVE